MSAPILAQFVNADMSAEIQSDPFPLDQAAGFSVQAFFSGSPNGTLTLEGRNCSGIGFVPIGGPSYTLSVAAAGNQMFEYGNCNFKEARLHWVPAGGSGQLSAYWFAKRSS